MTFLPEGTKIPAGKSRYLKFQVGENRFRILTSPIIGMEIWTEDKKPLRRKLDDTPFTGKDGDLDTLKYFWAMVVWNVEDKQIQVLEITQKSIMKELQSLSRDKDWGSPFEYDITVNATGERLDRRYTVTPKPKVKLTSEVGMAWEKVKDDINLEKLFDGEDPFGNEEETKENVAQTENEDAPEISESDIPF